MLLRRGALLVFNVIRQIQGHAVKNIIDFDPNWALFGLSLQFEFTNGCEIFFVF